MLVHSNLNQWFSAFQLRPFDIFLMWLHSNEDDQKAQSNGDLQLLAETSTALSQKKPFSLPKSIVTGICYSGMRLTQEVSL